MYTHIHTYTYTYITWWVCVYIHIYIICIMSYILLTSFKYINCPLMIFSPGAGLLRNRFVHR